jgi:hypothetical protein
VAIRAAPGAADLSERIGACEASIERDAVERMAPSHALFADT